MFSRYYHRNSFNLSRWNIILLNSILLLDVRDTTQVHILVCCSQSRRADSTECECFCSLTAVLCCWMWKQFDFFFNFVRWDSLCCDCDDDDDRAACRFPEINGKNNTNFLCNHSIYLDALSQSIGDQARALAQQARQAVNGWIGATDCCLPAQLKCDECERAKCSNSFNGVAKFWIYRRYRPFEDTFNFEEKMYFRTSMSLKLMIFDFVIREEQIPQHFDLARNELPTSYTSNEMISSKNHVRKYFAIFCTEKQRTA